MAQPFDAARGEFTGQARQLSAPLAVRIHTARLLTDFSANTRGMLVYSSDEFAGELRWRDRGGKLLGSLGGPGEYYTPRISPDGRRVAFSRRDGNDLDIGVAHPATNSLYRHWPGSDDGIVAVKPVVVHWTDWPCTGVPMEGKPTFSSGRKPGGAAARGKADSGCRSTSECAVNRPELHGQSVCCAQGARIREKDHNGSGGRYEFLIEHVRT